jgi:TnpA family transposase
MAGVGRLLVGPGARAQKISRRAHWLSDPDLRQHSHAGLNKGEASN